MRQDNNGGKNSEDALLSAYFKMTFPLLSLFYNKIRRKYVHELRVSIWKETVVV
jgi:hypothetical protein